MKELAVVIPVYNEEEAIGAVLDKWVAELDRLGIDYTVNPYNDGSKDGSWNVIRAKEEQYPGKVIGHDKKNSGHGPTILQGYRDAARSGYEWVFQIDSDDEMGPEGFAALWKNRSRYDFLVGTRDGRKQALPRKIISAVSRLSVRLLYGHGIWDVNTPYRLMRVSSFRDVFEEIPSDTFAPNVIISGMAAKLRLRCYETRVPQHDRTTGEVSIKKWKLLKAAAKSFFQSIFFAMDQKPGVVSSILFSGLIALLFVMQFHSFRELISGTVRSDTDSSIFLTIARAMLRGELPYRDLFDHKGLHLYFVDVLGLLTDLALIEWICYALAAWFLYRLLLLVVRPRLALFLMILWPLLLLRHSLFGFGNQAEDFILPAIAYALYYSVSLIKRNGKVCHFQTLLLGAAIGWGLMMKFNCISVFVAALVLLLWFLCRDGKWTDLALSVLSGLCGLLFSLIPGILYLWKNDLFSSFYDSYILFNSQYAGSSHPANLLRIFRCWTRDYMPNGIVRLVILAPWLSAFILFLRKDRCDRGDKTIVLFVLVMLCLDAVLIWANARVFSYYFIPLTLTALLAYSLILKYAVRSLERFLEKKGLQTLHRRAIGLFCVFIVVLFCASPLLLTAGIKRTGSVPGIPAGAAGEQDAAVRELLTTNGGRLLVLGSKCLYYRLYDAVPDCRYFYQHPVFEVDPEIWNRLLDEIREKKTPLILLPADYGHGLPDFVEEYLRMIYSRTECPHGTLFIRNPEI